MRLGTETVEAYKEKVKQLILVKRRLDNLHKKFKDVQKLW